MTKQYQLFSVSEVWSIHFQHWYILLWNRYQARSLENLCTNAEKISTIQHNFPLTLFTFASSEHIWNFTITEVIFTHAGWNLTIAVICIKYHLQVVKNSEILLNFANKIYLWCNFVSLFLTHVQNSLKYKLGKHLQ